MIEPKNRELQAVRIEVAINLCIKYPNLGQVVSWKYYVPRSEDERLAKLLLINLMNLEPCIKKILSFYYKRGQ
jgi:hypothetical protein